MSAQGFLARINFGATGMRRLMNLWPPFRGAGVHVREIAPDFSRASIELRMRLLNRNYVGTHFGGSLYTMTDPFFMLMMMKRLGSDYIVWDKAGAVRYLRPGRGTVVANMEMPDASVDEARARTADGSKFEPTFHVAIKDAVGVTIAEVEKTLYIRRKK